MNRIKNIVALVAIMSCVSVGQDLQRPNRITVLGSIELYLYLQSDRIGGTQTFSAPPNSSQDTATVVHPSAVSVSDALTFDTSL